MAIADTIEQIQNVDFSDIERIGVWPILVRVALWVMAVLVIFFAAYFVFVKNLNVELSRAENREVELKKTFESRASEAANLEELKQQLATMEETFKGLVAQLPSGTEVPDLIEDIQEKGTATGLNIIDRTFQEEKVEEFYVELPIELKVQGTYHDLGGFVSGIAGMPRIVTLHDFTISQSEAGRGLDMTILARTYRYKSQDE
ncbi:type 4a pilus biogenesis protein PilO [Aurantivibrio infirmus]